MKKFMDRKGFTLVELLITITLISILVAMFMSLGVMNALRRGRDAKLRGDINNAQKAYEQYYTDGLKYGSFADMDLLLQKPLSDVDQKLGSEGYCVCAVLEVSGTGNAGVEAVSGEGDCILVEDGDAFCALSVQEDYVAIP